MSKAFLVMTVLALCFSGCTANLMLNEVRVDRSIREVKTGKKAVIASVNYWSGNQGTFTKGDEAKLAELKKAVATLIYNSSVFEDVIFTEGAVKGLKSEKRKKVLYLDVMIYTTEIGGFNWWITWPGVWPMPGYWPVQRKLGTVSVNIEVTVSDEKGPLGVITAYGADDYKITFYGFYRTETIERSAGRAFMNAAGQLKTRLAQIDSLLKKRKDGAKMVPVGDIREMKSPEEVIVKHAGSQPLRMGELLFAESGDEKVKLIVTFPMMTASKCRLVRSSDYSRLKKNMSVFRH